MDMKTWRYELSDGKTAEIEGPANATADQVYDALIEQLDPATLEVERTKNTVLGHMLRKEAQRPRPYETPEQQSTRQYGEITSPEIGHGEGLTRIYGQGGGFGWMDEATAQGAALMADLANKYPGRSRDELAQLYLSRERGKIGQYRKEYPVASFLGEAAGAATTGMALPMPMPASAMGKAAVGGTMAGTEGFVYGAGAGEGRLAQRLAQGAQTAMVTAPIGAATPFVGNVAAAGWNRLRGTGAAAKRAGISRPAYEILGEVAEADNYSGAGARNVRAAGRDAMLADAGPTSAGMVDYLGQRGGPSARIIREAVTDRVERAGGRVNRVLDDTLGEPGTGRRAAARGISQRTARGRQEAYDLAYAQPIDYTPPPGQNITPIEDVISRTPRKMLNNAIEEANDAMRAEGLRNQQMIARVMDDGVEFAEMPNVQQLDYLKQALQQMARENVDKFGRPTGIGMRADRLAQELRDALVEAVPEYRQALALGGNKIMQDEGLKIGLDLLKTGTTREAAREFVQRYGVGGVLPDDVADMVRTGLRQQIDDTLANVRRTITDPDVAARETRKLIGDLSSRANREKVAALLGEADASTLFREIDEAATAFNLRAAVSQNSKTAARGIADERLKDAADSGVIENLRRMKPAVAAREAGSRLAGRSPEQVRRQIDARAEEIAEMLVGYGIDPEAFLNELNRTMRAAQSGQRDIRRLSERLMVPVPPVAAAAAQQ